MLAKIEYIPFREVLHYLGWRGSPVDEETEKQIRALIQEVLNDLQPRLVIRRFPVKPDGTLCGTAFKPQGEDIKKLLASSEDAVLIAATLGAHSERQLLRAQAQDSAKAVLLDAVYSAAIEAVVDQWEEALRTELVRKGLYLTDRFSPGYGDLPMSKTREICEVLSAQREIGLTVSSSGIMIPRKSVTALLGVSTVPVNRRPKGCAACEARAYCALRRPE